MSTNLAQAVDYAHLKIQAAEDVNVMREVLQLFLVHTEQVLEQLASASDEKAWRQLTHTLKGSARGIGAFSFADAAAIAERAILDKHKLDALVFEFAKAKAYIASHPL